MFELLVWKVGLAFGSRYRSLTFRQTFFFWIGLRFGPQIGPRSDIARQGPMGRVWVFKKKSLIKQGQFEFWEWVVGQVRA